MIKIAIIYHSETGNTERMARMVEEGCSSVPDAEARLMSLESVDEEFLGEAEAVILGCPNYEGSCSWQMKKFLDIPHPAGLLAGRLGGVFVTQNWPGGGGGSFAEMTMIAGMLVRGMLIYAGGIAEGHPPVHFGAVACKTPQGIDRERAVKLGRNIAAKAAELWG
ncbi:MAG: flavodoxin domain-containing protein [Gemmatimonadota bacterium]|nr:flavodoxin domain-containing protein [Gemmatimonadota bacterium]